METSKILLDALSNHSPIVAEQAIKETTFKYIGGKTIDLHISINKNYIEKIILNNIADIKESIWKIDGKIVRDFYINNIKVEKNISELKTKENIDTIDIDSLNKSRTKEMSVENNIVGEIFKYEVSVVSKKYANISLYNKKINKEFKKEIPTKYISGSFYLLEKRKITKQIKEHLKLGYKINNNDTKEIVEILNIL